MAPSVAKKFRVLIVDDSAFMRKVLETILMPTTSYRLSATRKTAAKLSR